MICRDLRRSMSRQGRMDMCGHIGAPAAGRKAEPEGFAAIIQRC
jgi:hypothetical protein